MRFGRRLAIDVGTVRIGVAVSDPHGILATPLGKFARGADDDTTKAAWREFLGSQEALADATPLEMYVGLPTRLAGGYSASTRDAIAVGNLLAQAAGFDVRFVDERLTTVSAAAHLRAAGRDSRTARGVIDGAAAAVILEQALQIERNQGIVPGLAATEVANAALD